MMETNRAQPTGMFGFSVVWIGQLASLTGSAMTQFALALWAWQQTGSATALALMTFFAFGPTVLLSPVAGALIDRWNRKRVMIMTDVGAGVASIAIVLLYAGDSLAIWHLYVAGAVAGAFQAFQWPAYSAAITTMVRREQYGRANGMFGLANSAAEIAAPLLAGLLISTVGIAWVLYLDIATFLFAVTLLALVHIPQPPPSADGQEGRGSLWQESLYGFRYILRRPSLLGLQLVFLGMNLLGAFFVGLLAPMILARTGDNAQMLATVLSASGIGGVAGGLVMSAWGGPRPRVHGILGGMALASLFGSLLMGIGQSLPLWVVAAFCNGFFIPILNGSNQAIWQAKVAPDVQGRVFAARRMIAQICLPLGLLLVGPLADAVFEPGMQPGGALAPIFGGMVGVGPGAGMALIIALAGLTGLAISLSGYLVAAVRDAERILPDYAPTPT